MNDSTYPLLLTGLTRSHATIQANRPVFVRGKALPGQTIDIHLGPHASQTTADPQGRWRASLPSLPSGGPYLGYVAAAGHRRTIENLHVGEVWLCAGQSNMAMSLVALDAQEVPQPDPQTPLCFTQIPSSVSALALSDAPIHWQHPALAPKSASGMAFHFAHSLHSRLRTPVAFVQSAVGHTPAMAWTPRAFIQPGSTAAQRLAQFDHDLLSRPDAVADLNQCRKALEGPWSQWNKAISAWQPVARAALAAGRPMPPMPPRATGLGDPHAPTVLYNAMLAPLQDEPIAGILWYQGESDAILGLSGEYPQSLAALVRGLRHTFGDVPVVIVELPRHYDIQCDDPDEAWPAVRWAQQSALADPTIGVVPSLDLGDTEKIHPTRKRELARRAADIALALAYPGHPASPRHRHGPILDHARFIGGSIELSFKGIRGALALKPSDAPNAARFEALIADTWHTVAPRIAGPSLLTLATPMPARAVRYAWAADPLPTLFDSAGDDSALPVSPFVAHHNHP